MRKISTDAWTIILYEHYCVSLNLCVNKINEKREVNIGNPLCDNYKVNNSLS